MAVLLKHLLPYIDSKVVTRAVFQLSSDKLKYRYSFELTALSEVNKNTIKVELKPLSDAPVGQ